jgi:large subunit ribosomal protein L19
MNAQETVESVVADQLKPADTMPAFTVGDTINVHVRIIEGDKDRRIVANEGVERIFPLHSPRIAKIEVVRRGDARRSKLYFLRERVGKSRRLRDQRRGLKHVQDEKRAKTPPAEEPAEEPAQEPTDSPE